MQMSEDERDAKDSASMVSGEDSMPDLLFRLEQMAEDVEERYARTLGQESKGSTEVLASANDVITRVIFRLRRCHAMNKRDTWIDINRRIGSRLGRHDTEPDWLKMMLGKRLHLTHFRDVVGKVQTEIKIVRHWQSETERTRHKHRKKSVAEIVMSEVEKYSAQAISMVTSWFAMDVFELETSTQKPLTNVFMAIWLDRRFHKTSKATKNEAVSFVTELESRYNNEAPYHNRIHAADVTATAYYLLSVLMELEGMQGYFVDVDILVVMLAAACHDVGHPAVNNDFMAKTSHPLALRYNDKAILENFHVATFFELSRELGVDMLAHTDYIPPASSLRARVIDMVLATDMACHRTVYEELIAEVTKEAPKDINKLVLEKNILHTADIGHPLRPFKLHSQWSERILLEFYAQGDQEKLLGFEPISLFDRDKAPPLAKGQLGFLNFVLLPAWKPMLQVLGEQGNYPNECLQANLARWQDLAAEAEAQAQAAEDQKTPTSSKFASADGPQTESSSNALKKAGNKSAGRGSEIQKPAGAVSNGSRSPKAALHNTN